MKTRRIPFDINKAKSGAKVVTRAGYPVRIGFFDAKSNQYPIIAAVETNGVECPYSFTEQGRYDYDADEDSELDLFIEEEVEEDDSDYDPYKATVESIADMVERYSELQSIEELKDFYNNVRVKCQDAFDYGRVCMINLDEEPDDNKPKFHKSDWVIDKHGMVQQITDVRKYLQAYEYSTISYSLGILSYSYFSENEKDIRLWNIKDAKDGDVFYSGEVIFIFNRIKGEWIHCYCTLHRDGSFISKNYDLMHIKHCKEVQPATKEQHDLLFQKMKEAGYEWDSDKKELHKIGESKTRLMTHQELADWLRDAPEEHREYRYAGDKDVYNTYDYPEIEAKTPVDENIITIRRNHGEWQEPLIEE
jgi:hypothetical protein